jgi:hypothetical protein
MDNILKFHNKMRWMWMEGKILVTSLFMHFKIQVLFLENIKYNATTCNKQDGKIYNVFYVKSFK